MFLSIIIGNSCKKYTPACGIETFVQVTYGFRIEFIGWPTSGQI